MTKLSLQFFYKRPLNLYDRSIRACLFDQLEDIEKGGKQTH